MRIWFVLNWACRFLLAVLRKFISMYLTDTLYLNGEPCRLWIEVNPETVSLDCNNVQKAPLSVRFWMGEGSEKIALAAFLTLKVESVVGSSVTALYTYASPAAVSSYSYTIPSNNYPTANRISVYAYEDAARKKEIASKQVNIVVENPVPFPRSEAWATGLTYKNGEYLLLEDVIYMWGSRVPGNTSVSPKADLSSATPSGKWKSYQNWPLLATNIALIKFGLIGSAVFKDEYMYSQQGINAAGAATNDYTKFATDAFTPNLMLNFLTGEASFANKNITFGADGEIVCNKGIFKIGVQKIFREVSLNDYTSESFKANLVQGLNYVFTKSVGNDTHSMTLPASLDLDGFASEMYFYGNPGWVIISGENGEYPFMYNGMRVKQIKIGTFPRRLSLTARKSYLTDANYVEWWITNTNDYTLSGKVSDGRYNLATTVYYNS